jgi:hypothetical protein
MFLLPSSSSHWDQASLTIRGLGRADFQILRRSLGGRRPKHAKELSGFLSLTLASDQAFQKRGLPDFSSVRAANRTASLSTSGTRIRRLLSGPHVGIQQKILADRSWVLCVDGRSRSVIGAVNILGLNISNEVTILC